MPKPLHRWPLEMRGSLISAVVCRTGFLERGYFCQGCIIHLQCCNVLLYSMRAISRNYRVGNSSPTELKAWPKTDKRMWNEWLVFCLCVCACLWTCHYIEVPLFFFLFFLFKTYCNSNSTYCNFFFYNFSLMCHLF